MANDNTSVTGQAPPERDIVKVALVALGGASSSKKLGASVIHRRKARRARAPKDPGSQSK